MRTAPTRLLNLGRVLCALEQDVAAEPPSIWVGRISATAEPNAVAFPCLWNAEPIDDDEHAAIQAEEGSRRPGDSNDVSTIRADGELRSM